MQTFDENKEENLRDEKIGLQVNTKQYTIQNKDTDIRMYTTKLSKLG